MGTPVVASRYMSLTRIPEHVAPGRKLHTTLVGFPNAIADSDTVTPPEDVLTHVPPVGSIGTACAGSATAMSAPVTTITSVRANARLLRVVVRWRASSFIPEQNRTIPSLSS